MSDDHQQDRAARIAEIREQFRVIGQAVEAGREINAASLLVTYALHVGELLLALRQAEAERDNLWGVIRNAYDDLESANWHDYHDLAHARRMLLQDLKRALDAWDRAAGEGQ